MNVSLLTQQGEMIGQESLQARIGYSSTKDALVGLLCIGLWLLLFTAGMLLPADPHIVALRKSAEVNVIDAGHLIAALLLFTYTNVPLLVCLAGAIGGISSRMTLSAYYKVTRRNPVDLAKSYFPESIAYRSENPASSVFRSFAVYLLYIAGLSIGLVGIGAQAGAAGQVDAIAQYLKTTPDQYLRMAGLLSVVGFVVGYDPTIFTSIITRFRSGAETLVEPNKGP